MKRAVLFYAVVWGFLLSGVVVLTNVILPTRNESDDEYTGWYIVLYLGLFLLFAIGGAINTQRLRPLLSGVVGGVVTAAIIIGMIFLTFALVDNIFLNIVSQQVDRVIAFRSQTTFTTMRDYINSNLLHGAISGVIAGALLGGALGALGSFVWTRMTRDPSLTVSQA